MGQAAIAPLTINQFAENLATFALDREDIKALLAAMPDDQQINRTTVEYEIQILKILSVGWGISFYMPEGGVKSELNSRFWEQIREFSSRLSQLTHTTTGRAVNYFNILKQRMDRYVAVMKQHQGGEGQPDRVSDPAWIMGPAFAEACLCPDNAAVILTGTKMFTLTLGGIKAYIEAVELRE